MRKELIVFVNTIEKNEEFSVSSVASNRNFVILTSPTGGKFTANAAELIEALNELESFKQNGNVAETIDTSQYHDIEYGE